MTTAVAKAKEKRKHQRVPVGITMDIVARGASVGKCRGTIADLSAGGMTFKSNAELEKGMCLHLKLNIPLEIRGEICHATGAATGGLHRYGVRFHKIGYALPQAEQPQKFIAAKFREN